MAERGLQLDKAARCRWVRGGRKEISTTGTEGAFYERKKENEDGRHYDDRPVDGRI